MKIAAVRLPIAKQMLAMAVIALVLGEVAMVLRPPRPHAVVNGAVFDFGVVPQRSTIRHTWILANEGRATLTVRLYTAQQGVSFESPLWRSIATIPPGGKLPVVALFITAHWSGRLRSSFVLDTNDPGNRTINLSFEGVIDPAAPALAAEPSQ